MKLDSRKPPDFFDLAVGSTLDGYAIESVTERRSGGELVAATVDPDGFATSLEIGLAQPADKQAATRLRKLARLRAELRHPGLVPVQAVGEHAGRLYMVTERYPAQTFADLVHRGPIEVGEVFPMLATACAALDQAHAAGLVHQRFTAESLLVDEQQLVLDAFGIAGGPPDPIRTAVRAEAILCMPPEVLRGEPLEPASNVYSLACLLVLALTGTPPFEGTPAAQATGHRTDPPPAPSTRVPALGPDVDRVIKRALAKHPGLRPSSAGELLSEVAEALGVTLPAAAALPADAPATQPRRAAVPDAVPARGKRRARASAPAAAKRRPGVPALAAVIAVGLGLVAGTVVAPFASDGGDPSARASFRAVLQQLDESRTTLRTELASAETPAAQAATAAQLAEAYGRAAGATDSRPLEQAARGAERAYLSLAAAARDGDADGFGDASRAVERAERATATAAAPR
jgi:protein kinase-like protein